MDKKKHTKKNTENQATNREDWGAHKEFHDLDNSTVSSTDCTGLIPALPQSRAEIESYQDLYPFLAEAKTDKEKTE